MEVAEVRSRNIKPGILKNEDLAECTWPARWLFPALWMMADADGRLEDRVKRINAEVFPYDDVDTDSCLNELASRGFIERYQVNGVKCIQIKKFLEHQTPHKREKSNGLPAPPSQKPSNFSAEPSNFSAEPGHSRLPLEEGKGKQEMDSSNGFKKGTGKVSAAVDALDRLDDLEALRVAWNESGGVECSRITENSTLFWDALNRLNDPWWRENWREGLARIRGSPWLTGKDRKANWRGATLGWFTKDPDNLRKLLDGEFAGGNRGSSIEEDLGISQ